MQFSTFAEEYLPIVDGEPCLAKICRVIVSVLRNPGETDVDLCEPEERAAWSREAKKYTRFRILEGSDIQGSFRKALYS